MNYKELFHFLTYSKQLIICKNLIHLWQNDEIIILSLPTHILPIKKITKRKEDAGKIHTLLYLKNNFSSDFSKIFEAKLTEIEHKIALIEAYKQQDFSRIAQYNELLFGSLDPQLVHEAQQRIDQHLPLDKTEYGPLLTSSKTIETIKKYLKIKKISWVTIETTTTSLSRISISYKKWKPSIKLLTTLKWAFRKNELEAKLVHEIDVHLQRYLRGKQTGRNILMHGTANYLTDEEWLAIRHSEQYLQQYIPDYQNITIYYKYILTALAQEHSFKDMFKVVKELGSKVWIYKWVGTAFNTIMKLKKWIQNTAKVHTWAIYMKEKVYLEWYKRIEQYVQQWGDLTQLEIGKIKVSDREFM